MPSLLAFAGCARNIHLNSCVCIAANLKSVAMCKASLETALAATILLMPGHSQNM